nr:hypothetical protein K-LCC10_0336 [Kaumoebavirus]
MDNPSVNQLIKKIEMLEREKAVSDGAGAIGGLILFGLMFYGIYRLNKALSFSW